MKAVGLEDFLLFVTFQVFYLHQIFAYCFCGVYFISLPEVEEIVLWHLTLGARKFALQASNKNHDTSTTMEQNGQLM